MNTHDFNISVLIPTRARTDMLFRSIQTLFDLADNKDRINLVIGFDRDDAKGIDYFSQEIQPWLSEHDIEYSAMIFEPMGYGNLNVYYNWLAKQQSANWYLCWSDDATMDTQGWDTKITEYNDKFKVLKVHTHNEHPYSIFPIVPHKWYELLGILSRHQMPDAEISQMAYMLDIIEIIDVSVTHDRADLTGKQPDATHQNRVCFEGNPNDPRDFHHHARRDQRMKDCATLATYMHSVDPSSTEFFKNVLEGRQDPWEKLAANDINKQQIQFPIQVESGK